jgi:hypothetical protein
MVMARWVERALRDLRGSVAEEALPEMAVQLAQHRLLLAHRMAPLPDDPKRPAGSRHATLVRRSAG